MKALFKWLDENCILVTLFAGALVIVGLIVSLERSQSRPRWYLERNPVTDQERVQIAAHVQKVLAATPATLAGNDQDWDHAINAAHRQAAELFCRPRLWEYVEGRKTGRSKEIE